jgi:ribosomal protein S18 acetylase RimI-like enzyme
VLAPLTTSRKNKMYIVESTVLEDIPKILELYRTVAAKPGGVIRFAEEITQDYIRGFVARSLASGIALIIANPEHREEIVAEIHAYQYGLAAFRHILTDLTIVVHPAFQGQKIGKLIFEYFLDEVEEKWPTILRVELFVRESNEKAIGFYRKLGFVEEGRHKNKIKNKDNLLETPIEMTWFNPNYDNKSEKLKG